MNMMIDNTTIMDDDSAQKITRLSVIGRPAQTGMGELSLSSGGFVR
jgi:hypothetical protein